MIGERSIEHNRAQSKRTETKCRQLVDATDLLWRLIGRTLVQRVTHKTS